jgi:hypothetical protein
MALNLSTLTNASTSATVLAEAQTTADFLDSVPILKNIARGSNKGGDAKQTTALHQPKALPVVDGKGYLYLSGVTGNYASVPDPLGSLGDFTMQIDGLNAGAVRPAGLHTLMSQYEGAQLSFLLRISAAGEIYLDYVGSAGSEGHGSTAVPTDTVGIRVTRVGTLITYWVDTGNGYVSHATDTCLINPLTNTSNELEIGSFATGTSQPLLGKISRAVIWDNGTAAGDPVLDVDFTATNVRHGDTKFKCATGQTVTINQAGNDPATVIKKSVLRFDGVNDGLQGLFSNNIDSGYMFAAFSILGDGGEPFGRILSVNAAGSIDYTSGGWMFANRQASTTTIKTYVNGDATTHAALFDEANGDILYHVKVASGSQSSFVNDADPRSGSRGGTLSADTFNLGQNEDNTRGGGENAAFDLEYLAVFPVDISDAEAARVVTYINNRNNVFDLKDSLGYYFFDPQSITDSDITSTLFTGDWDGRIVGSDLGDNTLEITQGTGGSQPVADKYKLTFADDNDHLLFDSAYTPPFPAGQDKAWQICGTSLGTFAYKINNNSQTELNLLGNVGDASYRQAGDLYGIILLPETATGADIEAARKLLIDRGASDGTTATSLELYWIARHDMVEFKGINTSSVTNLQNAYRNCGSLTSYPFINTSNVENFHRAWQGCTSLNLFPLIDTSSGTNFSFTWSNTPLTSFPALDMSSGTNFISAWQSCAALTSFPAGAKLGTAAENVNFDQAFLSSGLTALPAGLDMSQGANFSNAFNGCGSLATIGSGVLLGTANETATVDFTLAFHASGLTALPAGLDMSQGDTFYGAFAYITTLTTIGNGVLLGTASSGVNFTQTFRGCTNLVTLPANLNLSKGDDFQSGFRDCSSLVDFPAGAFDTMGTPKTWCFLSAWLGTNALSTTSVFNILSSIDTSGQSGPTIVTNEADITIDYNTVGGTSPLSAATNTAVTSLKGKGWVIVVNGTTL